MSSYYSVIVLVLLVLLPINFLPSSGDWRNLPKEILRCGRCDAPKAFQHFSLGLRKEGAGVAMPTFRYLAKLSRCLFLTKIQVAR